MFSAWESWWVLGGDDCRQVGRTVDQCLGQMIRD